MHNDDEKQYKAINFDLDDKLLRKFYPSKGLFGYKKAYSDIKKYMLKNGFAHRQYSGYISDAPLSNYQVAKIIASLSVQFPWLKKCVQKFDITNIGDQWDVKSIIQNPRIALIKAAERDFAEKNTKKIDKAETRLEIFKNIVQQHSEKGEPSKQHQKSTKKDDINL